MPKREIENRRIDADAGLEYVERTGVGGQTRERDSDGSMDIDAIYGFRHAAVGLREQAGPRQAAVLLALRDLQVRQDYLRVLLERQSDGVFQRELQRRGVLRERGPRQRQGERDTAFDPRLEHDGSRFGAVHLSGQL